MKQLEKKYKRIVVKIGSSLFYCNGEKSLHNPPFYKGGKFRGDFSSLFEIVRQITQLVNEGKEVVVISSGAIALGMSVMNLESRPKEVSWLQALAAIGQNELMDVYRDLFKKHNLNCSQVLLTWDDFDSRPRYLNAKNTLLTLLKLGSVPVINENDTISTDEIRFGDNDRLSALVSTLINADLLIILSDVDGLLDKDKKTVIKIVDEITPQIKSLALPTNRKTSVGGMITKIEAAKISVDSGIPCVIANGRRKDIIINTIDKPQNYGTLFVSKGLLKAKERWLAFGTKPKGKVFVDEGAKKALLNKKSLLSVGVSGIEGNFECSDIISIVDKQGNEFARGKICVSCKQLDKIKGIRFEKEVVHCDNIVILS